MGADDDDKRETMPVFEGAPYLPRLLKTTPIVPAGELRALWVVRDALSSRETVERMVDFAKQARFHMIFVQVRGRGDAFYRSQLVPPGGEMERAVEDFDPLEYVLVLARQAGISVHAWLNVYYVWSDPNNPPPDSHVVNQHPEWFLADPSGTRMVERHVRWWTQDGLEGYYVSPGSRGFRRHFTEVVEELLHNYAVDGVHLDYVRYPGREYGLDAEGRTDFALRWGIDPVRLNGQREVLAREIGDEAVAVIDSIYTEYRAARVDSLVLSVRGVVGDLPLSAAVLPDPVIARYDKGQDWTRWVHRRWVSFVVPMMYNYRPTELLTRLRAIHNTVGHDRVLVGLALHDGRSLFLPRNVAAAREAHATGVCLFSYNVLSEMRFPARMIEEAFFPEEEQEP